MNTVDESSFTNVWVGKLIGNGTIACVDCFGFDSSESHTWAFIVKPRFIRSVK